eukprot:COSAG04_NODE_5414_length_1628_cov_0.863309_1_plen_165_part_00
MPATSGYAELPAADEDTPLTPPPQPSEQQPQPPRRDGRRLHGRCGRRHAICWFTFCSGSLMQAQRVALPIAMVRMQSTFGWDKALQGQLLSAFFLGYFLCQLPGGILATKYSPSRLLALSVAVSSLLTLCIPTAAVAAPAWLYAARAAQGSSQGPWSSSYAPTA